MLKLLDDLTLRYYVFKKENWVSDKKFQIQEECTEVSQKRLEVKYFDLDNY